MPRSEDRCAYCGIEKPQTRDHVPPKGMFAKPRPSDLVSVPCCTSCHSGWSNDDEYYRTALLTSAQLTEDKRVRSLVDAIVRSVGKPEKRGFSRLIEASLVEAEVRTPSGVYLGDTPAFRLDVPRIARVNERIIRGLFFHEYGSVLPSSHEVRAKLDATGTQAPKIAQYLAGAKVRVVGNGVFEYASRTDEEDRFSSLWLACFYGMLYILGASRPRRRPE